MVLLSSTAYGLTASIGNARMILHAEAPTLIERTVKVNNVNNMSVDVKLTAGGNLKDQIEILDNSFSLAPGESVDARFAINLEYGGQYEGKIMVAFRPTDPNTKATPVSLASTIIISATGPENPNPPVEEPATQPQQPTTQPEPTETTEQPTSEQKSSTTTTTTTAPTKPTTSQPTASTVVQPSAAKASPLVGAVIILVALIIGSLVYFVYMRK
jgi:hypothetical protein